MSSSLCTYFFSLPFLFSLHFLFSFPNFSFAYLLPCFLLLFLHTLLLLLPLFGSYSFLFSPAPILSILASPPRPTPLATPPTHLDFELEIRSFVHQRFSNRRILGSAPSSTVDP